MEALGGGGGADEIVHYVRKGWRMSVFLLRRYFEYEFLYRKRSQRKIALLRIKKSHPFEINK